MTPKLHLDWIKNQEEKRHFAKYLNSFHPELYLLLKSSREEFDKYIKAFDAHIDISGSLDFDHLLTELPQMKKYVTFSS